MVRRFGLEPLADAVNWIKYPGLDPSNVVWPMPRTEKTRSTSLNRLDVVQQTHLYQMGMDGNCPGLAGFDRARLWCDTKHRVLSTL
jgi:hypothetical protein